MASQVLNGSSNPSYTNNTGQNVRLLLNVLTNVTSVSWAGVTADLSNFSLDNSNYGESIFLRKGATQIGKFKMTPPYQLTLAPGQSFSAVCANYNIIVITEDGT